VRPRKQTSAARLDANCKALADSGSLEAAIRVPDAAGDVVVQADLRAKRVTASVAVNAPEEGRPATRVNWLLKQLKEAPESLVIEASFPNTRSTTAALLKDAREDPRRLLLDSDSKRPPRGFRLALSGPMGAKRGKGERSFVLETRKQTVAFYRDLVQDLRPWRASAPRLPDEPEVAAVDPSPEPPAFSATDERAPAEAPAP
jgi:hypothetical protein